jgi:hypothetical protein
MGELLVSDRGETHSFSGHLMCMLVDKVALETILFRTLWFYPVGIILLVIYVLSLKPDLLMSAADNGLK